MRAITWTLDINAVNVRTSDSVMTDHSAAAGQSEPKKQLNG